MTPGFPRSRREKGGMNIPGASCVSRIFSRSNACAIPAQCNRHSLKTSQVHTISRDFRPLYDHSQVGLLSMLNEDKFTKGITLARAGHAIIFFR